MFESFNKLTEGAASLARAFGFARMEGALAAFDASRTPVAAIDRVGEVVRLNLSAERLLGAYLQVVKKRLVSFNRDATTALDRALHTLIWTKGKAFHPPVVLPRRFGRPIIAYPSRLAPETFCGLAACAGFVASVDLDATLAADGSALAKAFGLTPAEARLAVRFLAEESLEAAAEGLGISIDAARNGVACALRGERRERRLGKARSAWMLVGVPNQSEHDTVRSSSQGLSCTTLSAGSPSPVQCCDHASINRRRRSKAGPVL